MRRRAAAALLALALPACAKPPPSQALIQLEVLRGFAAPPQPREAPPRVEILLDLTTSMRQPTAAGPLREAAARNAARRFVSALGQDVPLGLHVLGSSSEEGCQDAVSMLPSPSARSDVLELVKGLGSSGEGSLAASLENLGSQLSRGAGPPRARVVAFTDLGGQCGGDLCAVADTIVAEGVTLDLVVVGDALVPECLGDFREVRDAGPPAGAELAAAPRFHLEATALGVPAAVAWGTAGGVPVSVEPGPVTVVIEFDPPLRVERTVAPGERWRLQVLEFPAIDPWARRWHWSPLPDPPLRSAATPRSDEAPLPPPVASDAEPAPTEASP